MKIIISNSANLPIYDQIANQIKDQIISGELPEGDMLPSMRTLAKDLHISLITTKRAYEELERDGFIESYTGKGSFVCKQNMNLIREEKLKEIENHLNQAAVLSKVLNLTYEDLTEMLSTIFESND